MLNSVSMTTKYCLALGIKNYLGSSGNDETSKHMTIHAMFYYTDQQVTTLSLVHTWLFYLQVIWSIKARTVSLKM